VNAPEHPYTQALIGSTLDPEPAVRHHRLEGIVGAPPDLRHPPSGCRFHPRCIHVMEPCQTQDPPKIGDPDHFAACWWVAEKSIGSAGSVSSAGSVGSIGEKVKGSAK